MLLVDGIAELLQYPLGDICAWNFEGQTTLSVGEISRRCGGIGDVGGSEPVNNCREAKTQVMRDGLLRTSHRLRHRLRKCVSFWGVPSRPVFISQAPRAAHLIWTGYGHWLPNDPRGSGSNEVRSEPLSELGAIHPGRKAVQPPKAKLKRFYREAEPRLLHPTVWFDDEHRVAMAQAIGRCVAERGWTCWALAILRNHAHAVIRTHRDRRDVMWDAIASATRGALHDASLVPTDHPVWSERPFTVGLTSIQRVRTCVRYVEGNPIKEGLAPQRWACVTPFVG